MFMLCSECNDRTDVHLVKGTDTPRCTSCQGSPSVTKFTIQAMKSNKDFMEDKAQGFSFMCESCGEHKSGLVDRPSGKVVCTACNTPLKVTPFMVSTMKNLKLYRKG